MTEPTMILIALIAGGGLMAIGALMWFLEGRKKNKAIDARMKRLQ